MPLSTPAEGMDRSDRIPVFCYSLASTGSVYSGSAMTNWSAIEKRFTTWRGRLSRVRYFKKWGGIIQYHSSQFSSMEEGEAHKLQLLCSYDPAVGCGGKVSVPFKDATLVG